MASFDGTNGSVPYGSLVMDGSGNLYGTTVSGGADGDGTIFELAKGSSTITTLASFDGTNGTQPASGLVMDSNGNLYGTTEFDGADGDGTIFELSKGSSTITVLASFNGTDGEDPAGSLVMSSNGNLYGTATEQLTVSSTHGTVTLASTKGLTISAGSNGSASVTVKGTLANLNAALNGLKFTPTTGFFGSASLTLSYKDLGSSQTASATVAITVNPPASLPTVTVKTLFPIAVPGEPVPIIITVADTNATAQAAAFSITISFGDGTSETISSKSPLLATHVYTTTGTFTVSVTATDEYGHSSATATTTIKVQSVALEVDPFNSSLTALFVGTSGTASVAFTASGKNVGVTLDGVNEGTFATSGPLIVFGQGGKDTVTEAAGLKDALDVLETATADNIETDLEDELIKWAGVSAAVEILNA